MNGLTNGLYDGLLTGQGNGLFDGLNNGLNNGLFNNEIVNDSDAQNFINAIGTLNEQQKLAIKTLVFNLKANNLWNLLDCVYPIIGGTASSHKFNLKNSRNADSAFRLTFSGGVTHDNNGMTGNGLNGWASTFYNNLNHALLNSHHISFYSRTNKNTTEIEMGIFSGVNYTLLEIRTAGITYPSIAASTSFPQFSDGDARGYYIANRTASNVSNGWKNGVKRGTSTVASTSLANVEYRILAVNGAAFLSTKQCAFATIGKGLNDSQATILSNIVQLYQMMLNRAVPNIG